MKYTNLGKSDLKVSRICMGCMGFGSAAAGQHSRTVGRKREMLFDTVSRPECVQKIPHIGSET